MTTVDVRNMAERIGSAVFGHVLPGLLIPLLVAGVGRLSDAAEAPGASTKPSEQSVVGYIFGVPVPAGNYYFAKRVASMYPRPGEERLEPADRERVVWEALILHYEAFRRGVTASDQQLEERINTVLSSQQQSFTKSGDQQAYIRWVKETVGEDVELFENQMRFLLEIDLLKDRMRPTFPVTVTEQEMQEEFLNERHHVGGEMAVFETREDAQAFYERVKDPAQWEASKATGQPPIKPVGLMTLEAYIDLWGVPKDQIYAFHAMETGSVGPPMPFGKQWCVYRLLEKRTGNLADFPARRDAYYRQIKERKQYESLKQWVQNLRAAAHLKILPLKP
jgi:hypothetical protein